MDQYSSRNRQLERKREHLSRELIKQSSHLESLESQIRLVRENYADPQMDSIANELKSLNEQFSVSMRNNIDSSSSIGIISAGRLGCSLALALIEEKYNFAYQRHETCLEEPLGKQLCPSTYLLQININK